MEVLLAAFVGSVVGVIVSLGGSNMVNTYITVVESRRQVEQLRVSIDNATKAGIPISYEIKN